MLKRCHSCTKKDKCPCEHNLLSCITDELRERDPNIQNIDWRLDLLEAMEVNENHDN